MEKCDVLVIGAGPGGYVAAIRAAQLGFKVFCVDNFLNNNNLNINAAKEKEVYALGGTCLNVGCIPSKALLQSSENFHELQKEFSNHGITCDNVAIDIKQMLKRKDEIVAQNSQGVKFLFKKNKITSLEGTATIKNEENGAWLVEIVDIKGNKQSVLSTNIIIATGSKPRQLPNIPIDNKLILDNVGALDIAVVPKNLGVIGAGVIGLELGSLWQRLGSKVSILEALPVFYPQLDADVSKELENSIIKSGIDINLAVKIIDIKTLKDQVTVKYKINEIEQEKIFDKLIVAIGRIPNTDGLGAENVGLLLNERGEIIIDDSYKTNLHNIFAVGDCVRGPMLAHKASEEGVAVAEIIAGQKPIFNLEHVPFIIYTNPEVAWVGKTEAQLKREQIDYKVGKAKFAANGRALALGSKVGFVKIVADKKTDRILGVQMIGPFVSELITQAVIGLEFSASTEDINLIIHAHPTLTEVIHEASLNCDGRQING